MDFLAIVYVLIDYWDCIIVASMERLVDYLVSLPETLGCSYGQGGGQQQANYFSGGLPLKQASKSSKASPPTEE